MATENLPAIPDPHTLLARALELGAGIDTIERLVGLAREVRAVRAREAWYAAMAAFQQQCPTIKKSLTARVQTARAQYSYQYAPLDEILAAVQPVLTPLGLSVSWRTPRVEPGHVIVACRIAHALGHVEESGEVAVPVDFTNPDRGGTPAQRVGSALTYGRRYSLVFALGLAPEDDDDAATTGPSPGRRQSRPREESGDRPVYDVTAGEAAPEPWEILVSDFVARFDEATTRDEANGWLERWAAVRATVPAPGQTLVQAAINRARKRLP